jgi:hypothetical protein
MGCDIHVAVEYKRKNEEKWFNGDNWRINPHWELDERKSKYELNPIYDARNYTLFGILAGVRRSENDMIAEPKGFPKDSSLETREEYDSWDGDVHTPSYLTLKEIKDYYNRHKKIKYTGMVTPEDSLEIDRGNMPDSWCKWTNIPNYIYREWNYENIPLKNLIESLEERK